jgi:hypothetical protein
MAERSRREPTPELTADELEQRQRADGTWEPSTTTTSTDGPLSPDQLEQRQRLDGSFDDGTDDLEVDGPLTPDMIEQRQVIEDDDAEDHPTD